MKFLVLALCVCAASAASFGNSRLSGYKPFSGFNSAVNTAGQFATPVVAPVAKASAAVYQPAQQVAAVVTAVPKVAAAVVTAVPKVAAAVYQPAQQVVTKTLSYANKDAEATILRSESEVGSEGYNYAYETANGITGQASGVLKKVGEEAVLVSQGTYSYVDPEGKSITVNYIADENGFQPQSDILPVGPAIPEAIARSLAYIAAHPPTTAQKY